MARVHDRELSADEVGKSALVSTFVLVHRSHSVAAFRHRSDERIPAVGINRQETGMFTIPVQPRDLNIPGGKHAQSTDEQPSDDRS
jgi:hypothetical protein